VLRERRTVGRVSAEGAPHCVGRVSAEGALHCVGRDSAEGAPHCVGRVSAGRVAQESCVKETEVVKDDVVYEREVSPMRERV